MDRKIMLLPFFRVQHNCIPGTKEDDLEMFFIPKEDLPTNIPHYLSGNLKQWVEELVHCDLGEPVDVINPDNIPVMEPGDVAYAVVPMGASGAPRYKVSGNSEISFMRITYAKS